MKKGSALDLLALVAILLFLTLFFTYYWESSMLGGNVLAGSKIDLNKSEIYTASGMYVSVSRLDWILNIVLNLSTFIFGILSCISFLYFFFKYVLKPSIDKKNSKML